MCSQAWITKIRQMDKGTDGQKLGDLCRTHFARCSNKRNCFIERKIDNVVSIYTIVQYVTIINTSGCAITKLQ